jgi:hypothetical protein
VHYQGSRAAIAVWRAQHRLAAGVCRSLAALEARDVEHPAVEVEGVATQFRGARAVPIRDDSRMSIGLGRQRNSSELPNI